MKMHLFATFPLALALLAAPFLDAREKEPEKLTREKAQALIGILETKSSPNVYAAVYYPRWKKPMDGLKSVTAEAIAEDANAHLRRQGVKLEVVTDPFVKNAAAAVVLKRSGGKHPEGVFVSYLYRGARNGWGFLGFPLPYKSPRMFAFMADEKFMDASLNAAKPFEGPLYEFDAAAKADFAEVGAKALALKAALDNVPAAKP